MCVKFSGFRKAKNGVCFTPSEGHVFSDFVMVLCQLTGTSLSAACREWQLQNLLCDPVCGHITTNWFMLCDSFQPGWHRDKTLRYTPRRQNAASVDSLDINIAQPCEKYPSLGMNESCKLNKEFSSSRHARKSRRVCLVVESPKSITKGFFMLAAILLCVFIF